MERAVTRELPDHRKSRIYIQLTEYNIRLDQIGKAMEMSQQAMAANLTNPILLAIHDYLVGIKEGKNVTMPAKGDVGDASWRASDETSDSSESIGKELTDYEKYEALCRGDEVKVEEPTTGTDVSKVSCSDHR